MRKKIKLVYLSDRLLSTGSYLSHKGRIVGEVTQVERIDNTNFRVYALLDDDIPTKELIPYNPPKEVAHLVG